MGSLWLNTLGLWSSTARPISRSFPVLLKVYPRSVPLQKYISMSDDKILLIQEAREKLKNLGEGEITLEQNNDSGIATVTIDHENKKNALSGSMIVQLEEVVRKLESWSIGKGVILKSAGDFFCSGGDLSQLNKVDSSELGKLMSTFMHDTLTRFYCLPMITIALVNGKAIGGGAELTTVSDFRLFSCKAEVSFVQGKMGLVTGWGGGTRLVKLVGAKTALDLLTTCRPLKPEEALRIGFADAVFDSDIERGSIEYLLDRIKYSSTIIRAMKEIVIGARDTNLDDSLSNERKIFSPLWGGPNNLAALKQNIKHR